MSDLRKPNVGDVGLYRTTGLIGAGIGLGQLIVGDASRYRHAFIVLDNDEVLEAEAGGAKITPLDYYWGNTPFISMDLTDQQRSDIDKFGRQMVGTPYSFLDYGSIALSALHIRPKFVTNYINNDKHMICSQLCDHLLRKVGYQMFSDGRIEGDITPGAFANRAIEVGWVL